MTHCCQNVCGFLKLLPESTERHLVQLNLSNMESASMVKKVPEMRLPQCTPLPSNKLRQKPWLLVI